MNLFRSRGSELTFEDVKTLLNASPKKGGGQADIKLVFTMDTESFYANTRKNTKIQQTLARYAIQSLPSLNENDAEKFLTNENGIKFIENQTKRSFPKETILTAIKQSDTREGSFPDKAIKLLSGVSKYYSDKDEILPSDIEKYIKETRELNEIQDNSDDINVIFKTGKTLDDIVGSPMTKADASSIVEQIKSGTIGTRGFRAYLSNGTSYGGGRRHVAEAIVGEANIPMIVVNAEDFALKDIDTLAQSADITELKIKKIISNAKAQAKINENNTAMIFIENFDNFAPDSMYFGTSIYEKKAFSQLLSEMENTRKNDDVNLIVVGSVNSPANINPNVMKPYKFLNSIIIYPPQDARERKEAIEYYINKMNLEIEGESKEEKNKIIKDISETTYGFSIVDIIYLLEVAKNVATERKKEKIDNEDLIEAYLQVTTGRPRQTHIPNSSKQITTSHEAGHAIALQILYNIAEKQDIPWHLPDKVNFLALDPRGGFSGAMFHKSSDNLEYCFEQMFSSMVCSYGGHSAEKEIYNVSGSLGITSDMENANSIARMAVLDMGMGKKTGVCHVARDIFDAPNVSEKKLQTIEEDVDLLTKSAMEISDLIIKNYKGFIEEFTEKYYRQVGTGNCIIPGETFNKELEEWKIKLPEDKKRELENLENKIIKIIENLKTK